MLTPLILASGKSTCMGTPKHTLQMPNGTPLYLYHARLLQDLCPRSSIYLSLAEGLPGNGHLHSPGTDIRIIQDDEPGIADKSKGPASGLLAAHRAYPDKTWLVIACDYPLLTK